MRRRGTKRSRWEMLRDQAERRKLKGRPVWSWGTPPTPDDPYPSNVVTQTYPDGTFDTRIPPATNKVIAEYEEAIETWPDCAELRMEYAFSLSLADMREQAVAQAQEAVRIRPELERARSFVRSLSNGSQTRGTNERQIDGGV